MPVNSVAFMKNTLSFDLSERAISRNNEALTRAEEHQCSPCVSGEKLSLVRRVILPAELTFSSVYMRKKLTPLPESRAGFPMIMLGHALIISP